MKKITSPYLQYTLCIATIVFALLLFSFLANG
jgi:hypothetical protein